MRLSLTYVPLVSISAAGVGLFWQAGNNVSGSLFIQSSIWHTCRVLNGLCSEKRNLSQVGKIFFNLSYVAADLYVHIYTCSLYVYVFIYTCHLYVYVFIYTCYIYVCMYVHIYMYISEAIELLNLPPSFLKTKIAFSNTQPQSVFPSFHLPVNSNKNQQTAVVDVFERQLQCSTYLPRRF